MKLALVFLHKWLGVALGLLGDMPVRRLRATHLGDAHGSVLWQVLDARDGTAALGTVLCVTFCAIVWRLRVPRRRGQRGAAADVVRGEGG